MTNVLDFKNVKRRLRQNEEVLQMNRERLQKIEAALAFSEGFRDFLQKRNDDDALQELNWTLGQVLHHVDHAVLELRRCKLLPEQWQEKP